VPKLVDHDTRREEIASALWRVVTRDGIEAASIRKVAAEAGASTGSLRHYFDSQSGLLAFAMEQVVERVTERVRALREDDHAGRLAQILPLDPPRRAEVEVWVAFTARALVDPALRPLRDDAHAALRELCRAAAGDGAEALHALVDGLALHGILAPDVTTPARQLELLREQLERAGAPSPR
jgi:AcrR family transcriptional regulator